MKKIVMILMMMITFIGFAATNKTDNFDYDKYVGSYILEYKYSNNHDNYLDFQIKKRGNEYIFVDFRIGNGYKKIISCYKLQKKNGNLIYKTFINLTFKNGKIIDTFDGDSDVYIRARERDIKYHFSDSDFQNIKYILKK